MCIDKKLNFNEHVSGICSKAGRQVNVLARLSRTLNRQNKLLLYHSFVDCYFNNCCVIWHSCSKSNSLKIEKIQEKAIRFITLDFSSSYCHLLKLCKKSPLYITRLRKMQELAYKILNGICPTYLSPLIVKKVNVRQLRNDNNIYVPKFRTKTYGQNSFSYQVSQLWNGLNSVTKNAKNITSFKRKIKEWEPICKCGFCTQCVILCR